MSAVLLTLLALGGIEYLCVRQLDLLEDKEFVLERAAVAAWSSPDLGLEDPERVAAVRNAMAHAWHGYETYAWGADELQPVSKVGKFGILGGGGGFQGLGASVIDAMSTLKLMGFEDEFERAHAWVAENMTFDSPKPQSVSFFETVIRVLGGLMAAHDLSGSRLFLDRADDLARRIAPVFQSSSTGIATNGAQLPQTRPAPDDYGIALAEAGSNLIEFGTLARRTGNDTYRKLSEAGMRFLHAKHQSTPLLGTSVQRQTGGIADQALTVAAPVDSYYEYLLKYWILGGKRDGHWRERWINATDAALDSLLVQINGTTANWTFVGELPYRGAPVSNTVTHLGCFYPGNVALGVISGAAWGDRAERYLDFAEKMMAACYQLYNATKTGLGADGAVIDEITGKVEITGRHYLQRPEVVESLFYLWRATHDRKYRDWGWNIFQAMEKYAKKAAGYSGTYDVEEVPSPPPDDVQQSWFLAETLKYLFLLFSDDGVLPLDEWVFNTEAHPMRVWAEVPAPWLEWGWLEEAVPPGWVTAWKRAAGWWDQWSSGSSGGEGEGEGESGGEAPRPKTPPFRSRIKRAGGGAGAIE